MARVGSQTISAGELERRLAAVAPFQLRTFGTTPEEIRRNFLERVLVREALLAEGAIREKLDQRDDVKERIRSILRGALLADLRYSASTADPVSDADVKAYYDANISRYRSPMRLAIWRILVASPQEATAILQEVKKDPSVKHWNDVAREKSLDKATAMRSGNLGFVGPDGTTAEAGVKVDPALFTAASAVSDAEVVPEPVQEGSRWAVVWRRQSMKPVERPLEAEAPAIRQLLSHSKAEDRIKTLVTDLRKAHLRELSADVVDLLDITSQGEVQPIRRPGSLGSSRRPSAAPPAPSQAPGGVLR